MDVVYILRDGENEELRYSLRSLETHFKGEMGNIWAVGGKPEWAVIEHMKQYNHGTKWANSTAHVMSACGNTDISDSFILMNDDIYFLKDVKEIPTFHRGPVDEVIRHYKRRGGGRYLQGMEETRDLVKKFCDVPLSYELHCPIVIHKERFLEAMSLQDKFGIHPTITHKRTLYGNYANIGGEKTSDFKTYRLKEPIDYSREFTSSTDWAFRFGTIGKQIRERFTEKSKYET